MSDVVRAGDGPYATRVRELSASAYQPPHRPTSVARPNDAGQVADLLAADDLPVTVRSGGHSLSYTHVRDGALALDLRRLAAVERLGSDRVAIGPGATVASASAALDALGLGLPIGHAPTVGLGGFLLSGGMGWNADAWGATCDRVVGADIVLADGTPLHLDDTEVEAMFALRGAGSAFPAVVTRYELIAAVGVPDIRRVLVTLPLEAAAADACLDELIATRSPEVEVTVFARPRVADGSPATVLVAATSFCHNGSHPGLRAITEWAPRAAQVVTVGFGRSMSALVATLSEHASDGVLSQHAWSRATVSQCLSAFAEDPVAPAPISGCSSILLMPAPRRLIDQDRTAFRVGGPLNISAYAHWQAAGSTPACFATAGAWADSVVERMRALEPEPDAPPVSPLRYVGEADLRTGSISECYRGVDLARLLRLRDDLDPGARIASPLDRLAGPAPVGQ